MNGRFSWWIQFVAIIQHIRFLNVEDMKSLVEVQKLQEFCFQSNNPLCLFWFVFPSVTPSQLTLNEKANKCFYITLHCLQKEFHYTSMVFMLFLNCIYAYQNNRQIWLILSFTSYFVTKIWLIFQTPATILPYTWKLSQFYPAD